MPHKGHEVLVGIPLGYGGVPPETFESLARACSGWDLKTHTGRTELNRNYLCQMALDGNYEYIVMLDVDHMQPADVVSRLHQRVISDRSKQVVAALCFGRAEPYRPLAWIDTDDDKGKRLSDWGRDLVQVRWTGTGAIIIATDVLRKVTPPWFLYLYDDGHHYPSEDIGFCEKCRVAGVAVWIDPTIIPPHLGRILVDEKVYRAYSGQGE
uniref:Glycosyltransferase n=1 Tax=viral metagenome TaxID=1070528 RepID=A0A6M3KR51_9ZZZZ